MRLGVLLSAALGLAISSGSPAGLATSILAPVIWLRQRSRGDAYICAGAYYLAALRSLPVVSRNFFGPESGLPSGICLWIAAATLLALPWLWAWSPLRGGSLWRCPIALLATIVPPLGLIGWATPVAAAGLLFPGTDLAGFAGVLFLPSLLLNSGARARFGIAAIIAMLHLLMPQPQPPNDWEGVNTRFGSVGHGFADLVQDYRVAQQLQCRAAQSKARVVVFPEAVAPSWIGDLVQSEDKTVLVGAIVPKSTGFDFKAVLNALQSQKTWTTTGTAANYSNKLLIRGAQTSEFDQRVPVPIGMWKPFTKSGVLLNLNGHGTTLVDGRRVAVLICYEELIAWPVLTSFLERPSLIVAISNNVWVSNTSIPKVERTTVRAWGALFRVPALFASNT